MTRTQLLNLGPTDLLKLNPAIPPEKWFAIRNTINSFIHMNWREPIYGINVDSNYYLTDGGIWNYRSSEDWAQGTIMTIEDILKVRPKPHTTHSHWTIA